jgi:DNA sulfur modification protein DndC
MAARKEILKRIDHLEDVTSTTIIDPEERGVIAALWTMDHFPRLRFKQ